MILCIYSVGSAPPATIALAAERFGGCTFVVHPEDAPAVAMLPVLRELADVVVAESRDDVVAALEGTRPTAVVAFAEVNVALTADLAAYYGLPGISRKAARWLTDKTAQRERLNDSGVGRIRSIAMTPDRLPEDIPLPAVVKPRAGAGSEDTVIVSTMAEFRTRVAELNPRREYVVEQYIQGAEAPLGDWLADYVSVESAVDADGRIAHLGITGRLPLAEPARETGLLFPVRPPQEMADALYTVAEAAVAALDFAAGLAHTEIKLTAEGPVVIEVNGRLGGGLHRLMPKAGGLEPVGLALSLAAGEALPQSVPEPEQYTLHHYVQPPPDAVAVRELPQPRALRALPGVFAADRIAAPGSPVNWRSGSAGRIYDVWLRASSLEELRQHKTALDEALTASIVWEYA
ncbi:ATP-grasp domain-containing protein [Streptomyces sp. Li-HN-5-11]|uniref:ATP-grasp domain-containing protein n=1 Tax=Streptomyces sp. Li-HN-5-11 TaxID=3075432 RepID=UPI0028A80CBD|nr:ATP-grasp domain-containing protein [Streptomyces sp. Li-HN-5-11]WNM30391.1 ATP-grasp domain-containing protein [Streptomyces sp. Li-HN-5-11]